MKNGYCAWSGATYWDKKEIRESCMKLTDDEESVICHCGKVVKLRKHFAHPLYIMISRHKELVNEKKKMP